MSLTGTTAKLAGKAAKWAGNKLMESTLGKAKQKASAKAEELKANHPHLVKSGKLTKKGVDTLVGSLKGTPCPDECGSARVIPDHVKRMYG